MTLNPKQERTNELYNNVKGSNSLVELVTRFYQLRPLHANSDTDELTMTIKLRPNKFTKRNIGKNVNVVDSSIELLITNNGIDVIDEIFGFGTDDSPSKSLQEAIDKFQKKMVDGLEFDLDGELA